MDTIILKEICADALIGLLEEEAHSTQELLVTLEAEGDFSRVQESDRMSDGVDYREIVSEVRRFSSHFKGKTLEYYGHHLAIALKEKFAFDTVRLTVSKPRYVKSLGLSEIAIRVER